MRIQTSQSLQSPKFLARSILSPHGEYFQFNIALSDIPAKKTDLVAGTDELDAPEDETTMAVKLTDMLGEEVLVVERV